MREMLRIGAGAGFSGDRLEPAAVLAERGRVHYLVLECLGERTVALAQLRRRNDPARGYDPLLERRIELLLPLLRRHGVRLVTNMGAANPLAAADAIIAIARTQKIPIRVAVVTGDDVLAKIEPSELTLETQAPIAKYGELVSANAYL
ncbi:MAG TPA: acyclic terpene utilization AtuA family protein, partial [Casimicrobiaceae bacterium]|nr:acyclic terpene utilization AtuA family protein [Casimicrobiaceae bacterium]